MRHHSAVDGVPQALPVHRKGTLLGLGAVKPSGEFAPTLPAPPRSPMRDTVRRPTPPSAVAAARRTDPPAASEAPPTSVRVPEDTKPSPAPPSASPDAAALAASRADAERLRSKVAELERDARAKADTKTVTFPPPVTPAPTQVVVTAAEPETDQVIGWLVKRAVANRTAIMGLVAFLGIGGGGMALKQATDKPTPPALTMAQLEQALDKQRTRKGGTDDQTRALNDVIRLLKCVRRQQNTIGEATLPAPDHFGSVRKPQPWSDECDAAPKLLPDP